VILIKHLKKKILSNRDMQTYMNQDGKEEILFLSQTDMEILIYVYGDIWTTPELLRFRKEILRRLEEDE